MEEKNVIKLQLVTLQKSIFKQMEEIERRDLWPEFQDWKKVDDWFKEHTLGYVLLDDSTFHGLYLILDNSKRCRLLETPSVKWLGTLGTMGWVKEKPHIFLT